MARSLVIVESPAKAKTINKYLGRDYTVKASLGHVMDLPKKTLGVLLPGEENSKRKKKAKSKARGKAAEKSPKRQPVSDDNIFEPKLEIIPGKKKIIEDLRSAASDAPAVYLAGDPDREGEAICAHLAQVLSKPKRFVIPEDEEKKTAEAQDGDKKTPEVKKKTKKVEFRAVDPKKIFRVTFNEITPKAIRAAFEKPGEIDTNLVEAQQARRVLDRLVGYKISPLLWDKVRRGLSAGRVQTVALRLIVEREQEIRAFVPQEYWTIHAMLDAGEPPIFEAKLFKYKGEDIEVSNQEAAEKIVAAVSKAEWQVATVVQKEKKRNPPPPFTTSKLQQAAYNRLRYTAKRTMALAQRLYEGVELGDEGSVALITYMRTDSVRVSNDALAQVRELIPERFGASQILPAVFDQTTIDISAGDYTFRATGSVQKFDGYLRVYQLPEAAADREEEEKGEEGEGRTLPPVAEGQALRLEQLRPEQHFTEPPPRYTEATLVKELEEKGIGRPSTYATII